MAAGEPPELQPPPLEPPLESDVAAARLAAAVLVSCLLLCLLAAAALHATLSAVLHQAACRRRWGPPPAPDVQRALLVVSVGTCASSLLHVPQFVAAAAGRWLLGAVGCAALSPLDTLAPLLVHLLQALLLARLARGRPLSPLCVPLAVAAAAVVTVPLAAVIAWRAWAELAPSGGCGFSSVTEWVHLAAEPAALAALLLLAAAAGWRRRAATPRRTDTGPLPAAALRQAAVHVGLHGAAAVVFVAVYVSRVRSVLVPTAAWYGVKAACPALTGGIVARACPHLWRRFAELVRPGGPGRGPSSSLSLVQMDRPVLGVSEQQAAAGERVGSEQEIRRSLVALV